MSIIKRKAGSEDIVKSILEFDDVPTEGSHNLVESGAVAQTIGNLGNPLQWKGPATVAELNAGITGIQPGWTYTLTDAGTLTDGSITVDVGDKVAWTEDGEWFKVGVNNKTLLQITAQNALAGNVAPAFVPNETNAVSGLPYIYDGNLYIAKQDYNGAWDATKFEQKTFEEFIENCFGLSGLSNIFDVYGKNVALASYNIGDVVDVTPATAVNFVCCVKEINGGDIVVFTSSGGYGPRGWAFLDTDYKLISVAPQGLKSTARVIKAPSNAAYVVLNSEIYPATNLAGAGNGVIIPASCNLKENVFSQFIKNNFSENLLWGSTSFGFGIATGNTSVGYKQNMTLNVSTTNGVAVLECSEGDIFNVISSSGSTYRAWAFLDKFNNMLSRADAEGDNVVRSREIVAPKFAIKLVVNFSINNNYDVRKVKRNDLDSFVSGEEGKNIALASYNIGDVVDLTSSSASGYSCVVTPCEFGDEFIVCAQGGGNPRAYAFVDKDDKLLSLAPASTYLNNNVVRAPLYAKKFVVQTDSSISPSAVVNNVKRADSKAIKYGDIKNLSGLVSGGTDYIWATLGAINNGVALRESLETPLTTFEKTGDLMVHVSTHKIINGVVYMTYYANTRSAHEEPTEQTARFVYAPMSDLSNKTFVDLMDVGETFDGKTVQAIYDTIFMTADDDTLYLMWTAKLSGDYYRLYKTYTISTNTYSSTSYNKFKVGSNVMNWGMQNMRLCLIHNGINFKKMSGDIGLMQKVTSITEGGVTYYYTGAYCYNFHCVVRSSDMITWEYVDTPPFENLGQWENACYIKGGWLYYSCRQQPSEGASFLTRFNLTTRQWDKAVFLPDCQSRNDFFVKDGVLYLVYAPRSRRHIAIMKINETSIDSSELLQDAVLSGDSFYPFVTLSGGNLYMSFTKGRVQIVFSQFALPASPLSDREIQNKVAAMLA
jgi:hypothetical protein